MTTNPPRPSNEPLPEREAAELLGVSPNKHWRWVGRRLRYFRLVGRVAYRPGDLSAWIDANVTEPGCAADSALG